MAKYEYFMEAPSGDVFRTSNPEYHKECKELPRAEGQKRYRAQVLRDIKKIVKPGQTIYCTLRHVSASGMQRRISLHTIHKGELVSLDFSTAILTGRTRSDKGGIVCNGCGMDMGFDLVYSLGYAIWPKGTPKPHGRRNGEPDSDGGYALKHCWI